MDPYKNTKDLYSNSAPEVAPQNVLPERAHQDHEGPQPVEYGTQNDTVRAYYGSGSVMEEKSQPAKGLKKMLLLSIVGAVAALAVGIGIGIGIGISVEKGNSHNSSNGIKQGADTDNSPSSTTATTSTSFAAPGSIATGSTTSLAAYSCTNGNHLTSSSDITYITDCDPAYLTSGTDLYNSGSTIANTSEPPYTRYNLGDYLDLCDRWNTYPDHADTPCRTVTYYATLTQAYGDDWMGNCFLKSGRPADIARSGDMGIDWAHTVSAYVSCLVNGGC